MNHNIQNVFVPNFPPPPLLPQVTNNLNTSSPAQSIPPQANYNLFKERLTNYLARRKGQSTETPSMKLHLEPTKLSEVSSEMSQCVHLVQTLNENIDNLSQEAAGMDVAQWNDHISQLNVKISNLSSICSKYNDRDVHIQVKSLIDKRQEKRNRIKKRKMETNVLKKYEVMKRVRNHQQIDEWIKKNAAEILKNRQQLETKQRAEQMFMDVKNRQNEADKFIMLMESLKELHHIRNRDKYRGQNDDVEFNREIEEIKQMWLEASRAYATEEKHLRKFINYTDNCTEWQNVLFGEPTKEDQIMSLRKKNDGFNQLIAIRRLWDHLIVSQDNPFASKVPTCWVLPNTNPSEQWKIYLKDQENL